MMENQYFTNHDWMLFRSKIAGWQEAYIDRLNKEYIALLSSDANASDKFWELEKRITADKKRTGVAIDMRRSVFYQNLLSLLGDGVITLNDLEEFSDEVKACVEWFCRPDHSQDTQ